MSNLQQYIKDGNLRGSAPYPKLNEEVLTSKRHPISNKLVYTQAFSYTTGTNDITGLTKVNITINK